MDRSMDDSRIIELYFNRDEEAIAETARKYGAYCFAVAENILSDRSDSEECVNDTWLKAWNSIPPERPKVLRAFLCRITRNLALDRYAVLRAKKRGGGETELAIEELSECADGSADLFGEYARRELARSIRGFVSSLPERERAVFVARYFYMESAAQIAKRFGLSENTVAPMLSRTRKKLRDHLEKERY